MSQGLQTCPQRKMCGSNELRESKKKKKKKPWPSTCFLAPSPLGAGLDHILPKAPQPREAAESLVQTCRRTVNPESHPTSRACFPPSRLQPCVG